MLCKKIARVVCRIKRVVVSLLKPEMHVIRWWRHLWTMCSLTSVLMERWAPKNYFKVQITSKTKVAKMRVEMASLSHRSRARLLLKATEQQRQLQTWAQQQPRCKMWTSLAAVTRLRSPPNAAWTWCIKWPARTSRIVRCARKQSWVGWGIINGGRFPISALKQIKGKSV